MARPGTPVFRPPPEELAGPLRDAREMDRIVSREEARTTWTGRSPTGIARERCRADDAAPCQRECPILSQRMPRSLSAAPPRRPHPFMPGGVNQDPI